eukprot:jgi/Chrzof1/1845/Cz10g23140.t1
MPLKSWQLAGTTFAAKRSGLHHAAAGMVKRTAPSAAHNAHEATRHKLVRSIKQAVNQAVHASAEAAYASAIHTKAAYAWMLPQLQVLTSFLKGVGQAAIQAVQNGGSEAAQQVSEGLTKLDIHKTAADPRSRCLTDLVSRTGDYLEGSTWFACGGLFAKRVLCCVQDAL